MSLDLAPLLFQGTAKWSKEGKAGGVQQRDMGGTNMARIEAPSGRLTSQRRRETLMGKCSKQKTVASTAVGTQSRGDGQPPIPKRCVAQGSARTPRTRALAAPPTASHQYLYKTGR